MLHHEEVFLLPDDKGLVVNWDKCRFEGVIVSLLGHMVNNLAKAPAMEPDASADDSLVWSTSTTFSSRTVRKSRRISIL